MRNGEESLFVFCLLVSPPFSVRSVIVRLRLTTKSLWQSFFVSCFCLFVSHSKSELALRKKVSGVIMDKRKLAYFTRLVLKERECILGELHGVQDDIGEIAELRTPEEAEEALLSEGRERLSVFIHRGSQKLEAVHRALERIRDGTYGRCTACGSEIQEERLEYLPTASLCLTCQSLKERNPVGGHSTMLSALKKWHVEEYHVLED